MTNHIGNKAFVLRNAKVGRVTPCAPHLANRRVL